MVHHFSPDRHVWIKQLTFPCVFKNRLWSGAAWRCAAMEFPARPLGASLLHEKLRRETDERRGRRGGQSRERGRGFISQVQPESCRADEGEKNPILVSFSPTSASLTCRPMRVTRPGALWDWRSINI